MKQIIAAVLLFMSYCLFFYGLFSFVTLESDYHNWSYETRFLYTVVVCIAAFWIIAYIIIEKLL
jgi:hypothetical protein